MRYLLSTWGMLVVYEVLTFHLRYACCLWGTYLAHEVCLLSMRYLLSTWGHAYNCLWGTYFPPEVYLLFMRYFAAHWKSSNTFCLLASMPPLCHVSPYSLKRTKIKHVTSLTPNCTGLFWAMQLWMGAPPPSPPIQLGLTLWTSFGFLV